ncbi:MAG: hypothetical protein RJB26_415 [Pseudomonadota bacterium]|jgi:chromosome segregation ATPase
MSSKKKDAATAVPAEIAAAADEATRFLAAFGALATLAPYLKDVASIHQASAEANSRRDAVLVEVAEAEAARDAAKAGADDLSAVAKSMVAAAKKEAELVLENARNREAAITRDAIEQRTATLTERDREAAALAERVAEHKASLVDLEDAIAKANAHLNDLREQGRKLAGAALDSFGG